MQLRSTNKVGRLLGGIILTCWLLLCVFLTVNLFLEGKYNSGAGWAIITIIFIVFACFFFWPFKIKELQTNEGSIPGYPAGVQIRESDDLIELLSTKDPLKVQRTRDFLISNDITCFVFDEQSSQIMNFMPNVVMRVMVHRKDFERSVKIINLTRESGEEV